MENKTLPILDIDQLIAYVEAKRRTVANAKHLLKNIPDEQKWDERIKHFDNAIKELNLAR